MKRNMSNLDRIVRVVLGVGFVAAGLAFGGVPAVILYLLAVIMLATAVTLHVAGVTDISTAAQAASALKPIAGPFAFELFAHVS